MSDRLSITTIFFDIGGVLLDVDEQGGLAEIARATGLPPDQVQHRIAGEVLSALERGLITLREYHTAVFRAADGGLSLPYEHFERIWLGRLKGETPVTEILPDLKRRAAVWLLSNNNHVHMDYVRAHYPFMALADGVISSYEVGHRKPDKEIFRLALSRAGVAAGQALFIDDKFENVTAASELGLHAHHYIGLPGLVGFLDEHGLKVPHTYL